MIRHTSLGDSAFERRRNLKVLIDKNEITFGGNAKLKIYGTLNCSSGKRMKPENRVFFSSETEAVELGYRPCGRCLPVAYKSWLTSVRLTRVRYKKLAYNFNMPHGGYRFVEIKKQG